MDEIIQTIMLGAAGDGIGGLLSGLLISAGKNVREYFNSEPHRQALANALEITFKKTVQQTTTNTSLLSIYYLECLKDFFLNTIVQERLSILLEPNKGFDYVSLRNEFIRIAQGYSPEEIPDISFDEFFSIFVNNFYDQVKQQAILQKVIIIDRLDSLVYKVSQQTQFTRRLVENTDIIVKHVDQVLSDQTKLDSHLNTSTSELILILDSRAEIIESYLTNYGLEQHVKLFRMLHNKHIKALENKNVILAHEILGQIYALLLDIRESLPVEAVKRNLPFGMYFDPPSTIEEGIKFISLVVEYLIQGD